MAYTITYKFGSSLDVGEAVAGEHLIRMSMAFTVQDTASNVEKFARDYGIHVASYGELVWERNIDENFMVPGQFNFSLLDTAEELWALLFEGALVPKVEKDAKVTLEINYFSGSAYLGYTTEFIGNIDNANIDYDVINKKVSFIVLPRTDILKGIYLYKESTNQSGVYTPNNPLSLSTSVVGDFFIIPATNYKTIIHEIFKKISPTCTMDWRHTWLFLGKNMNVTPTSYDEFLLENLNLSSNYLSALFFSLNNIMNIESLYDLLIMHSFTFGFICGMITSEKAFVKELYAYDSSNTQTLGIVKKMKVSNKHGDIDSVRTTMRFFVKSKKAGYYDEMKSTAIAATIPYGSEVRGDNNIDEEITCYAYETLLQTVFADHDLNGTYGGNQYEITKTKPAGVAAHQTLETAVANFYYNLRNRAKVYPSSTNTSVIGRVDELTVEGINYDYLKDFSYAGNGYQILSLKKDIANNESLIKALVVEDTMEENTPESGDGYPRPFTNILPGGYLKSYEYNAEIDTDDANAGGGIIYSVMAGTLVKRITLLLIAAFNNISAVTITDNDGTLKDSSEIIWDTAGSKMEVILFKEYATGQDIIINFTKTGTVTTGEIDCIVEISRKD